MMVGGWVVVVEHYDRQLVCKMPFQPSSDTSWRLWGPLATQVKLKTDHKWLNYVINC